MTDKKSTIGFVLIMLVFLGWMFYSGKQRQKAAIEQQKQEVINKAAEQEKQKAEAIEQEKKAQKQLAQMSDSANVLFNARQINEGTTTIENELIKITINNKGGQVCKAVIKDETYKDQNGNQIVLFDENDANMSMQFDLKEDNIITDELYFTPTEVKNDAVVMSLPVGNGDIKISYSLIPNSYLLNMSVAADGIQGVFPSNAKTFNIVWKENLKQQEKGFDFENRYSTITYRTKDNDTDELSSAGADKEETEFDNDLQWISFKNQFFAQILIADKAFKPTMMSSKQYKVNDAERKGHLKTYEAQFSTEFDPSGVKPTAMTMYLGPNKFSTLKENEELLNSDKDLDLQSLVYLGWPLIKYINRFFMLYLFDWMTGWGINMGIILTILTLVIKFAVYPLMRKSYLSTARMRVLKPKIEEIAKKYPKKEDAMMKQQETMRLYSEYGVSPMGGCLPMLIQMPIWIALFNFIPNAIELRGQSFLWSKDLSSYDDIISWNTSIWGIGDHLSIFCVLWCLSTIISSFITQKQQQDSAMSDEQAQTMKMMKWMYYIMPLIFFFSFNGYSSGLNYYYFLSTIISVIMMWFLRKTTDDNKLLMQLEKRHAERKQNNSGVNRTSSLMERMQAMAQKQQEMLEQQRAEQEAKRNKK